MKPLYMFRLTQTAWRTGEHIGVTVGVIEADTQEEAENRAWELHGSDTACGFEIWELIPDRAGANRTGKYTVYRSEM